MNGEPYSERGFSEILPIVEIVHMASLLLQFEIKKIIFPEKLSVAHTMA